MDVPYPRVLIVRPTPSVSELMDLSSFSMWLSLFLVAFLGTFYAYFGYPLILMAWARLSPRPVRTEHGSLPSVSIIMPVHNEETNLPEKLTNLDRLDFPRERMEVLVVSDASTDATVEIATQFAEGRSHFRVIELVNRGGKAGALNAGQDDASHDILVFTDAGIMLEPGSLKALVRPFLDRNIGCVSGEDQVEGEGGESLYGRYELFLRRKESEVGSIVGASGSFYAQRRDLSARFPEGIAPDLLSVLRTVDQGFRAVSTPEARGTMRAAGGHGDEFRRKVRTLVRGMTGLFSHTRLLNPLRAGGFAFVLFSHKIMRWLVPLFLVTMLLAHAFLLDHAMFRILAVPHFGLYVAAVVGLLGPEPVRRMRPFRIASYFVSVNGAILVAWLKYLGGTRQEIWSPTVRS